MATGASYGALPFDEQVQFFRRKLNLPTTSWADVYAAEHDWAFVVAGANRDAILADFRMAVDDALENGRTLDQFRAEFDRIVARHGWDYRGTPAWRSRVIYETNMRTSYAAGRWDQLQGVKALRPYWQYKHSDAVEHPRPLHLGWDGMVLHADDPWWQTHYPPNGWGCQCYVNALNLRDLQRMGKDGPDDAPGVNLVERVIGKNSSTGPRTVRAPEGIDPGFEYAPGRSRLKSAIPPQRPDEPGAPGGGTSTSGPGVPHTRPTDALPVPRPFDDAQLLPPGLPPEQYVQAYLAPLGATIDTPAIVEDVIGERLVVGADLFREASGDWKLKNGRERFLPLLAQALLDPDEIWVRLEWIFGRKIAVVRRRYIARFTVEDEPTPALAVFELGSDGWAGVTTFQARDDAYLEDIRAGVRLYQRVIEGIDGAA